MDRTKILLIVAGVLLVALLIYYGWSFFSRERVISAEELAQSALTAATAEEQETAAAKLAELGVPAKPHLVRVLKESKTPGVRAAAISGLSAIWDFDSMPLFLEALDDDSLVVRVRADGAVQRSLQADFGYHAGDSREARQPAIKRCSDEWSKMRQTPALRKFREKLKAKGF